MMDHICHARLEDSSHKIMGETWVDFLYSSFTKNDLCGWVSAFKYIQVWGKGWEIFWL